jgi:hypothetical protein
VNPSQEPAQPQHSEQSFADPTAEPAASGGSDAPAAGNEIPADGGGSGAGASGSGETRRPGEPAADGGGLPGGQPRGPWERPVPGGDEWTASAEPGDGGPGDGGPGLGAAADGGFGLAHPSGPEDPPAGYGDWDEGAVRRPWRRTALVGVLILVVVLVLGGLLGVIWHWLAPSVPVLDAGPNGIVVNDPSPEEYIAADGWYTLLGFGFGLVVAVVAWLVLRRDRGPILLLGVVLGTLGAGYLIGPWIGGLIGKGGYQHWQETAAQGATYLAPPEVHSVGPKLVPAFAAAIVLTLLAGWSNDPDLDEPGAQPGYGPNTAAAEPGAELHESEAGA